ncbi:LysR family transcriptional regulator [Massilia sp. CF038]|uniref:LysR family transcriptional regulator n=1 Tax=Massilia sp. CF038 TaxID=1881045 RepID=UPI0009329A25|nr:LysR family transcriptional regulator [Massilia sp. CF038]
MDQLMAMRAFARVVEAGTFTKAADSLGLPNATLTKLVQQLEAHLRVKLLTRTTRKVSVTAEGAAYYEKTTRLLKDLDDIDTSFTAAQVRPRGVLRVDIGSTTASAALIPALPEFFARYPDIRIDLGVSDRQVDMIGDSVDCAIRGGVITDLGLVGRPIGTTSWVTCASPAYLAQHGTPQHPDELERSHRTVNYLSAHSGRAIPLRFILGEQRIEVTGTRSIGVNESTAHVSAALAGMGLIQTFSYAVRAHLAAGALVAVLPDWQPAPYVFNVVYPPNRHLSQRLRVFIDWLAERFPALAA